MWQAFTQKTNTQESQPGNAPLGSQGSVDAILLASGFSARFSMGNKLLWPFAGQPLATHTLGLVCSLPYFTKVHFVYASPAVGALARGYNINAIQNTQPQNGQGESVRLGVLASSASYYMFFPCDQPLLSTAYIAALLHKRSHGKIVLPTSGGQPYSPTVFCSSFRQRLLKLKGGQSPRSIFAAQPGCLLHVPLPSAWPLQDIDTLEDAKRLGEYYSKNCLA